MNLFFCGDIMPGGVLPYQDHYITLELLNYLHSFDFRIGTLEAAIGTNIPYDPIKMAGRQNIVYARNEDFFRVKEMGFDVVSLANNHVFDLGKEGLYNTIKMLKDNNIQYCGAGMNSEEASRPIVIEKDNIKTAIFAYCKHDEGHWKTIPVATNNNAGVNPLDMDKVINDIQNARKLYDHIIIMPHWGREYTSLPSDLCIDMAKRMVDVGASAVLGSHAHQIQPSFYYKKGYICFSMGNFLFPDFYMQPLRPIWYPNITIDLSQIKSVCDYPFPIEEPMKRVWSEFSRQGVTISLSLSRNRINVTKKNVRLSKSNILDFTNLDKALQHELNKSRIMMRCRLFNLFVRCINMITNRN